MRFVIPGSLPGRQILLTGGIPGLATAAGSSYYRQRRAAPLILCALEGLSGKEAAAILKCPPRALEGRHYRARQLLLDWWNRTP